MDSHAGVAYFHVRRDLFDTPFLAALLRHYLHAQRSGSQTYDGESKGMGSPQEDISVRKYHRLEGTYAIPGPRVAYARAYVVGGPTDVRGDPRIPEFRRTRRTHLLPSRYRAVPPDHAA